MSEMVARFLLGGAIVSMFAAIAEVLKPKSFAGLFGAAPSVALATLGLAYMSHGGEHAAVEGKSMVAGGAAFVAYAAFVSRALMRSRLSSFLITAASWALWLVVAVGIWAMWLR